MGKIDIEFRSKSSQRTVGCIEQGICGTIIRRSEPFALEDSPERLDDGKDGFLFEKKKKLYQSLIHLLKIHKILRQ